MSRPAFSCRISPREHRACWAGNHEILVVWEVPASCSFSHGACSSCKWMMAGRRPSTRYPTKAEPGLGAEAPPRGSISPGPSLYSQKKKCHGAYSGITPGVQLWLSLVCEETSHLEVTFSSLSRNPIVRTLPALLIWACASWGRLTSWGRIQEMFILYFKISFKKKLQKKDMVIIKGSQEYKMC